jgi:hypothetical protein
MQLFHTAVVLYVTHMADAARSSAMSHPASADEPFTEPDPHRAQITDIVDRPTLRVSGPAEIVQLVPYILGFHPHESLVMIALRGRRTVVSARYDLDAPIDLATPWCQSASKAGADHVIALLYTDGIERQPLPKRTFVADLSQVFEDHALEVIDVLAVSDGRWWSYRCANPQCCPPEGTPVDATGAVAASAVSEGLVALPNRESLETELALDEPRMALVDAEIRAFHDPEDQQPNPHIRVMRAQDWAEVRAFVRETRNGVAITNQRAARVLCALLDRSVRDAAIGYLVGRPEDAVRDAWRELTRIAPPLWRAAPATLYAMWCFAEGSGARTNIGVDVALDANPNYALAQILLELQASGLNPFEFIHDMAKEAQLVGRRIQRKRDPSGRRAR